MFCSDGGEGVVVQPFRRFSFRSIQILFATSNASSSLGQRRHACTDMLDGHCLLRSMNATEGRETNEGLSRERTKFLLTDVQTKIDLYFGFFRHGNQNNNETNSNGKTGYSRFYFDPFAPHEHMSKSNKKKFISFGNPWFHQVERRLL